MIIMAYYGPNAELLGNIKLAIWQFQNPITDIHAYVANIILLLGVDVISLIINGLLLRIICNVNIFKVMKSLQESFWHVFLAAESFLLIEVSEIFHTK